MKDDDFKLLRGFADRRTDERTDICDCRVTFTTENWVSTIQLIWISKVSNFQLFMPHPDQVSIWLESLQAYRFYYFELPSVGQYCKQNKWGLVYFLYSENAANPLIWLLGVGKFC